MTASISLYFRNDNHETKEGDGEFVLIPSSTKFIHEFSSQCTYVSTLLYRDTNIR